MSKSETAESVATRLAQFSDEELKCELRRRAAVSKPVPSGISRLLSDVGRLHKSGRTITEIATWLLDTKPYVLPVRREQMHQLSDRSGRIAVMRYEVKRTLAYLDLKPNLPFPTGAERAERLERIVRFREEEGQTFKTIAATVGVSVGRVHQLYDIAKRIERRAPARAEMTARNADSLDEIIAQFAEEHADG